MSEHILTHKHQTHKHQTHNHAASDWRIHCGIEVTDLSTNKQHTLSHTGGDCAGDGGVRDGRLRMATLINGRDADRSTGSALMRSDAPALRPAHTSKMIERRSGAHRAPNERRSGAHRASTSRHIHAYVYTGEHQQLRHKAFDKPS